MNNRGVSFARWIQEESEQTKTLRNADSSGVLSDWCAPTPVDSSHYNNSTALQQQYQQYSSDKTWRYVLLGLCGGSIFTAVTSLGVLGTAGRQTTFQNLLEISLSPKQTRMLLLLNLVGIFFSALTASGVVTWFQRSRMRLLMGAATMSGSFSEVGVDDHENASNIDGDSDVSPPRALRTNSSIQALEDMIAHHEGRSPLRVDTPNPQQYHRYSRQGENSGKKNRRHYSNNSRYFNNNNQEENNNNNNDDDDEGQQQQPGMGERSHSHMEVFTAQRPASAMKGRRSRTSSALAKNINNDQHQVEETHVNDEQEPSSANQENVEWSPIPKKENANEKEETDKPTISAIGETSSSSTSGYVASSEQTVKQVSGDLLETDNNKNKNSNDPAKTIYDATPLQSTNNSTQENTSTVNKTPLIRPTPTSVVSSINSTASPITGGVVPSTTGNSTRTPTPHSPASPQHDSLEGTSAFFQPPSQLPPLPAKASSSSLVALKQTNNSNITASSSRNATPLMTMKKGNTSSNNNSKPSSVQKTRRNSVSSSAAASETHHNQVNKRDASTETQIEYFSQPPVQAPIVPLVHHQSTLLPPINNTNMMNMNNDSPSGGSSSQQQQQQQQQQFQQQVACISNSSSKSPTSQTTTSNASKSHQQQNNSKSNSTNHHPLFPDPNNMVNNNNNNNTPAGGGAPMLINRQNTNVYSSDGGGSQPSSFASVDAALSQQLSQPQYLQQNQQSSGNMVFAPFVHSGSNSGFVATNNNSSNNDVLANNNATQQQDQNNEGGDDDSPTHPAHHPDLHIRIPRPSQQSSSSATAAAAEPLVDGQKRHSSNTTVGSSLLLPAAVPQTSTSQSQNQNENTSDQSQQPQTSTTNNSMLCTPQVSQNYLQPSGSGVQPVNAVPNMAAFVPHAFRTIDLNMNQIQPQHQKHILGGASSATEASSRTQTPREPPGGRTGNFSPTSFHQHHQIMSSGGRQHAASSGLRLHNSPSNPSLAASSTSPKNQQQQNQNQQQPGLNESSFGSAPSSFGANPLGGGGGNQTLQPGAMNNSSFPHGGPPQQSRFAPPSYSPDSFSSPTKSILGTDPSGSLMGSPQSTTKNFSPAPADYKWWDTVTAATAANGTILAIHIGLKQDVQFSGSSMLPEAARNDLDSTSRLISIALEVGDSYGAVIDSFNLQWIIMSFNILRPCTDHEKMAALCALAIRTRFIQLSSLMTPQSSPMTDFAGSQSGSPLTNPSVRPLVPFSIGIEKGLVLGGHVGHGTMLRSFVLYGSPVERARDLAVLGATICSWMSPILVSETFNDLIGASCSSLLVDFVEFNCDVAGRGLNQDGLYESPMMMRHEGSSNNVLEEDSSNNNKASSSSSSRHRRNSGSSCHYVKSVVRVFDLYEEFEESEHSPFEAHLSPREVASLHNTTTDINNNTKHHTRVDSSQSNASSSAASGSPRPLSAREEMELVRKEVTEEYHEAVMLLRSGKLDTCLDACARLEGVTTSEWIEQLYAQAHPPSSNTNASSSASGAATTNSTSVHHAAAAMVYGSPNNHLHNQNPNNNNRYPGSPDSPHSNHHINTRIPVWLFQIRRHLSRLRRNAQNLLMKGQEGVRYVRQTQARWIVFAGDANTQHSSPSRSPHRRISNNGMLTMLNNSTSGGHRGAGEEEEAAVAAASAPSPSINRDRDGSSSTSNTNQKHLVSPSPPGTDDMFDKTYKSAMLTKHFSKVGKSRDTSLDMTARSLKMLDASMMMSKSMKKSDRKHHHSFNPSDESPSRMIALLQQQAAFNPNSTTAAAAAANMNNSAARSASRSSVPQPLNIGQLNSPDNTSNNSNNNNNNQNNNAPGLLLSSPSPGQQSLVMMNDGIPELFQDYNGTWYRSSTKVLGKGAFGAVRLGLRTYDGILVAMKLLSMEEEEDLEMSVTQRRRKQQRRILSNQNLDEEDQLDNNNNNKITLPPSKLDKIVAEIRLLTTLKNQNVVTLYTCAVVNSNIVIVLEYVSGGSLESLLNSFGTFDIPSTQRYMKDILRGLRYIHEKGYIHRDIKPGNVLIQTDGSCKLADLGSSIAIKESLKRNMGVQGTPYFISPEAARGAAVFTSDIWSVGIMACQLVSGQIPLKAARDGVVGDAGLHRLLYHLAHEVVEFDMPEQVLRDELLYSFVSQCLRPNAEDRPTAEQLLNHPFLMQQYRNSHAIASASPSAARKRRSANNTNLSQSHSAVRTGRNGGGGESNLDEPLSPAARHHNCGNGQGHLLGISPSSTSQHRSSRRHHHHHSQQQKSSLDTNTSNPTPLNQQLQQRQNSSGDTSSIGMFSGGGGGGGGFSSNDTLAPNITNTTASTTSYSSGHGTPDLPLSPHRSNTRMMTPGGGNGNNSGQRTMVPIAAIPKSEFVGDGDMKNNNNSEQGSHHRDVVRPLSVNSDRSNNNNDHDPSRNPFLSIDFENQNQNDNKDEDEEASPPPHRVQEDDEVDTSVAPGGIVNNADNGNCADPLAAFQAALTAQQAAARSSTSSSMATGTTTNSRSPSNQQNFHLPHNQLSSPSLASSMSPSGIAKMTDGLIASMNREVVVAADAPADRGGATTTNGDESSSPPRDFIHYQPQQMMHQQEHEQQQVEYEDQDHQKQEEEQQSYTPANRDEENGGTQPPSANSTIELEKA